MNIFFEEVNYTMIEINHRINVFSRRSDNSFDKVINLIKVSVWK